MNCDTAHKLLTAYRMGDLEETARKDVEAHLETCEDCRAALRDIEPTLDLLRDALSVPAPVSEARLSAQHRARIRDAMRQPRQGRVLRWLTSPNVQLSAVAAVLMIGFFVVGMVQPWFSCSPSPYRIPKGCGMPEVEGRKVDVRMVHKKVSVGHADSWGVAPEPVETPPDLSHDDGKGGKPDEFRSGEDANGGPADRSYGLAGRLEGHAFGTVGNMQARDPSVDSDALRRTRVVEDLPKRENVVQVSESPVSLSMGFPDIASSRTAADVDGETGQKRGDQTRVPAQMMKGTGQNRGEQTRVLGQAMKGSGSGKYKMGKDGPGVGGWTDEMNDYQSADVRGDRGSSLAKSAPEDAPASAEEKKALARELDGLVGEKSPALSSATRAWTTPADAPAGAVDRASGGGRLADRIKQRRDELMKMRAVEEVERESVAACKPAKPVVKLSELDGDGIGDNAEPKASVAKEAGGGEDVSDVPPLRVYYDDTDVPEADGRAALAYEVGGVAGRTYSSSSESAMDRDSKKKDGQLAYGRGNDNSYREQSKDGKPADRNWDAFRSAKSAASDVAKLEPSKVLVTASGTVTVEPAQPVAVFDEVSVVKAPIIVPSAGTMKDVPASPAPDKQLEKPRFRAMGVNPFVQTATQPFSTFSIDVDTASYTLSRNYMLRGVLPPPEAVRTEEFVNFFDYGYLPPVQETFKIYAECAPSRFGAGFHLLKIGVKGRRLGREEDHGAVLTFLVDTSGSMDKPDRIGMIRKSLGMLVEKLGPKDRVAIVQFDSQARLVLDHTPASERKSILAAIDALQCSGSTDMEAGMSRAYEVAARHFQTRSENRVLILSDGVANLGSTTAEDILAKVETYRKQGIFCSVFGFGSGTYDDVTLETIANKGNGTYGFIDSEAEAKRLFVDDLAATLHTIAADVKIQVEFNPKRVRQYRQLGYENRQLKKEDFRNDAVDAGEVGSGQSVTALYELALTGSERDVIGTVYIRYRRTDTGKIEEIKRAITQADVAASFERADARFRLAACVAEFAEILRGSPHADGPSFERLAETLRPVGPEFSLDPRVQELLRLVNAAGGFVRTP